MLIYIRIFYSTADESKYRMQGLILKFRSLKNMVIKKERRQNGMSKKDPFKINLRFLLIAIVC